MLDLYQYTDKLLSTPKITLFLTQSKLGKEKSKRESNPYPEEEYLSGSVFTVNLTEPNKQAFKVNSAVKSCDHLSNS